MKLFSVEQIHEWDSYTIKNEPISSIQLMERASIAISNWIIKNFPKKSHTILILIGGGNNGGDGLVVGKLLKEQGYNIEFYCIEFPKRSKENNNNYIISKSLNIRFLNDINEIKHSIIIDAIFGSGLSRDIQGFIKNLILKINSIDAIKISIDTPSGIHADQGPLSEITFKAEHTLTLQIPKISFFYRESADFIGDVHVLNIGLSEKFNNDEHSNFFLLDKNMCNIPKRKKFSHKGTFGHSLIIAGEMGKLGACHLAAKSSLRSGSGLTTVLSPSDTQDVLQASIPEAMTISYNENDKWIDLIQLKKFTSIGVGPGIGNHSKRVKQLIEFLPHIKSPIVLDADALNIISEKKFIEYLPKNSIITPHPGEFHRLFRKCTSTLEYINLQKEMSIRYQLIIVHKLAHTIISDPSGNIYFNNTGNPGMATAGSGDVLTGIITGLLAQGITPLKSAIIGVYQHGYAGDRCKEKRGETNMIASDLIEHLFID